MKLKYFQAHLDEFCFRHNRRTTQGISRIAAGSILGLVSRPDSTLRDIATKLVPSIAFRS